MEIKEMPAENTSAVEAETTESVPAVRMSQEGVEPRASLIVGAGQGLFATRAFQKGELVCEYTGRIYANKDAWQLADKSYLMKLGGGKYVDARECPHVMARFINDCRSRGTHNVVFDKRPQDNLARVVALRDISPDEELYVDYGRFYWLGYNLLHPENPIR
jgi:SET domain-containing protein